MVRSAVGWRQLTLAVLLCSSPIGVARSPVSLGQPLVDGAQSGILGERILVRVKTQVILVSFDQRAGEQHVVISGIRSQSLQFPESPARQGHVGQSQGLPRLGKLRVKPGQPQEL